MKSVKCAFHIYEPIVNFCRNAECLLPMCSKCIKIHSIEHAKQKTHGIFDSMNEISFEIESTLGNSLQNLLEAGSSLKAISEDKNKQLANLTNYLSTIKFKIIQGVKKYLDGLDKQVFKQISILQHSYNQQLMSIDEQIDKISTQAKIQVDGMNSDKKMKTIINHLAADMPSFYQIKQAQIQKSIADFEFRKICINKDLSLVNLESVFSNIKILYEKLLLDNLGQKLTPFERSQSGQSEITLKTQSLITKDCSYQANHPHKLSNFQSYYHS